MWVEKCLDSTDVLNLLRDVFRIQKTKQVPFICYHFIIILLTLFSLSQKVVWYVFEIFYFNHKFI